MRIGSKETRIQPRAYSGASATPADFGAGVARATDALGISLSNAGKMLQEREQRQTAAAATIDFIRTDGEVDRARATMRQQMQPGARAFTDTSDQIQQRLWQSFLERNPGLTEEQRTQFQERFETRRQRRLVEDFATELAEGNREAVAAIQRTLDTDILPRLRANPRALLEEYDLIRQAIAAEDLPPPVAAELDAAIYNNMAIVAYEAQVAAAADGHAPAGQPYERTATEAGAVNTATPTLLMTRGAADARSAILQMPDGTRLTDVRVGTELPGGATVVGFTEDGLQVRVGRDVVDVAVGGSYEARPSTDPVAPGLPGLQRGFLNALFQVESRYGSRNPYNVLYGGDSFGSYADHPRQGRRIRTGPHAGELTTAAGRYQFLAGTWDWVTRQMEAEGYDFGPERFSPVNQDNAALWYAAHRYRTAARQQGIPEDQRDIWRELQSGDAERVERVRRILAGSGRNTAWEGLQNMSSERFTLALFGPEGVAGGGTGVPGMPNLWADPRFARVPFAARQEAEQRATRQVAAAQEGRRAAREQEERTLLDSLRVMHQARDPGLEEAVMGALGSLRPANQATALGFIQDQIREGEVAREAQVAVTAGTPITPANAESMDAFLAVTGIRAGLEAQDAEARAAAVHAFRQTGQLGPDTLGMLVGMTNSSDPAMQIYALEMLSEMHSLSPFAFAALNNEAAREAGQTWDAIGRLSGGAHQALEQYNMFRTPEGARIRRERTEQAQALLRDVTEPQILRAMQGFIARNLQGVTLPRDAAGIHFHSEFRRAYEMAFVRTNDSGEAMRIAGETLAHSYHPDPASDVLMYASPDSPMVRPLLNAEGQPEGWIREALLGTVPQARNAENLRLISTARTLEMIARGEAPAYQIMARDGLGMISILRGDDNLPIEFVPRPTPGQLRLRTAREDMVHTDNRIQDIQRELVDMDRRARLAGEILGIPWTPFAESLGAPAELVEQDRARRPALEEELRRLQQRHEPVEEPVAAPQRRRSRMEIMNDLLPLYSNIDDPEVRARIQELEAEWRLSE
jgi:muramidase (phage lysozyme)